MSLESSVAIQMALLASIDVPHQWLPCLYRIGWWRVTLLTHVFTAASFPWHFIVLGFGLSYTGFQLLCSMLIYEEASLGPFFVFLGGFWRVFITIWGQMLEFEP